MREHKYQRYRKKSMNKKIILILFLLIALSGTPAAALAISQGPVLIQTTELPVVYGIDTDGRYGIIFGCWKNETMEQYSHKEGFEYDGEILIYDTANGKLSKVPGNIPPEYQAVSIEDGIITWTSTGYRFPIDNGNMRQETAVFQYTIGEDLPKHSGAVPGRVTREENGKILTVIGYDNHPEDTIVSVYDVKSKTTEQIPVSAEISPTTTTITGDYVLWQKQPRGGDGKIHYYNLITKETAALGDGKTYLSLLDANEGFVLYRESTTREYPPQTSTLRAMDLKTKETTLITDTPVISASIDPPVVVWSEINRIGSDRKDWTYPLYAGSLAEKEKRVLLSENAVSAAAQGNLVIWMNWDENSGVTRIHLAQLDVPGKHADMHTPQMEEAVPATTEAGMPLRYSVGMLAFVLACVLAVLCRK